MEENRNMCAWMDGWMEVEHCPRNLKEAEGRKVADGWMDGIPDHSSKNATGDFSSDPCEKVRGGKGKR